MWRDPIIAEVRRIREEYAAQYNYDIKAICRAARERQKTSGHKNSFVVLTICQSISENRRSLVRQSPHVHVIRCDGSLDAVVERGVESVGASGEVNLKAGARRVGIDFLLEILVADG